MNRSSTPVVLLSVLFCLFAVAGGGLLAFSDLDHHPFRLLAAIFFLIAAASILARPLLYLLIHGAGRLLSSGNTEHGGKPAYSMARAQYLKGEYEAAMQLYAVIIRDFPQEVTAYRAMIEIALENLRDPGRARPILEKGLAILRSEPHRQLLQETFDEGLAPFRKRAPVSLH